MFKFFSKTDKMPTIWSAIALIVLICLGAAAEAAGQTNDKSRNNPYSPSPTRTLKANDNANVVPSVKAGPNDVSFITHEVRSSSVAGNRTTIAQSTSRVPRPSNPRSKPPTEEYKVGVGDMLFVNLKNSPLGSGYFTVRADGTIDFPLAGDNVIVADQPTDMIEEILASAITLFPDPQVEVKVRQYSSHRITVSGLVESSGEKNLRREAIPLFAIRAEAGVNAKAVRALVTRAPLVKVETYVLRDAKTDDVLIYPGNSIEFVGDAPPIDSYFISGKGVSGGQKPLTTGITLYQAVIASAGAKGEPKMAILRRKNAQGLFLNSEYKLRSIKEGKYMDPILTAGDVIEIK